MTKRCTENKQLKRGEGTTSCNALRNNKDKKHVIYIDWSSSDDDDDDNDDEAANDDDDSHKVSSFGTTTSTNTAVACLDPTTRTASVLRKRRQDDDDDEDVIIVEAPPPPAMAAAAAVATTAAAGRYKTSGEEDENAEEEDDDDVAIFVGATAPNALADFPHSREHCVVHPFVTNNNNTQNTQHCPNCYCYVCDALASSCPLWDNNHCHASHGHVKWRKVRQDVRTHGIAHLVARTNSSSTTTTSTTAAASAARLPPAPPSTRAFAATADASTAMTITYPRPSPPTAQLLPLSPTPPPQLNVQARPDLAEYSLTALLQTIATVFPIELSPSSQNNDAVFVTQLRHYQKQSLAFMVQTEIEQHQQQDGGSGAETNHNRGPSTTSTVRGGWLCDEVGMGKTAVVLALIASNPMPTNECPTRRQVENHIRQQQSGRPSNQTTTNRLKVKTTIVMTSVSLIGQWEDEAKKHSPGLKVGSYHPSSARCITYMDLARLDVIISSSTFDWGRILTENFEFHRIVVDESHLFQTAPGSARLDKAIAKASNLRWCVTATPFTTSIADLKKQIIFLYQGLPDPPLSVAMGRFEKADKRYKKYPRNSGLLRDMKHAFYQVADELKRCMIRHTKSQRIHGSKALALPPSSTTTIMLKMTSFERARFAHANVSRFSLNRMIRRGSKTFLLQRCFSFGMHDISLEQAAGLTKIKVLVEDLRQMRRVEPSFRVVVFTQYLKMHDFIVEALKHEDVSVLEFTGSTSADKRDRAIRDFQQHSDKRPAVFVITLRAGNVGITLTAASRVYLMEPSMDPSAEVQAAGRIHRLGQNKAVQVKKFCFLNCVESNIVHLHKEIAASRISISDGFFPPEAVKILAKNILTKSE